MARLVLPGFRFHPTGVELLKYYLKRKVLGKKFPVDAIAEIDIYKHAPWDLPDLSLLENGDLKWFFFCPLEKKYPKGARLNRAALHGHWKATGRDKPVFYNKQVVGRIKTLVFHQGKSPKGDRTDWLMHEYRLEDKELADKGVVQDTYVLCVVYKKDGTGSKNGAQYGAPFKEEDYMSDIGEDDNVVGAGAGDGAGSGSVLPEQDEPSAQPGGLAPLADPAPVPDTNAAAVPVSNANALMEPEPPDQLADQVQDQFLKEDDAAAFMTYNNNGQMSNGKANDFAFEAPPYQVSEDDDISWTLATFNQFWNNGYYPVDYLF